MTRLLWPFYRLRFAVKRLAGRIMTVTEICRDCGAQVGLVWTADDQLWFDVMGDPGGVLCVRCFDRRAWDQGRMLRWVPRQEWQGSHR